MTPSRYSDRVSFARDTTPAARQIQVQALRRQDGVTKLLMALEMSDDARNVMLAGIRHRHPDWDDAEVHRESLRLLLGRELATRITGRGEGGP